MKTTLYYVLDIRIMIQKVYNYINLFYILKLSAIILSKNIIYVNLFLFVQFFNSLSKKSGCYPHKLKVFKWRIKCFKNKLM